MEDNSYLPKYDNDDVFSFNSDSMCKAGKLRDSLKSAFTDSTLRSRLNDILSNRGIKIYVDNAFGNGVDCEVLKVGAKGWQKGKLRIRVSVEFCPDEPEVTELSPPESPLDDLRQIINQETQQ